MPPEFNVSRQIEYWKNGAEEDLQAAEILFKKNHIRHALFFAHLVLEKMLKAHVCQKTRDIPPRIHDLLRLADLAGITLDQDQIDFLADINIFNLEGRYPEYLVPIPSLSKAEALLSQTKEAYRWLINQL